MYRNSSIVKNEVCLANPLCALHDLILQINSLIKLRLTIFSLIYLFYLQQFLNFEF